MLIQEVNTSLHACSIESLVHGTFVCGTYELNEDTRERRGEILIFQNGRLVHTTRCESGVLDMKFAREKLVSVLSTGKIEIYRLFGPDFNLQSDSASLELEVTAGDESEGLFLSVDIANRLERNCWEVSTRLAVSTQQGSILIYEYTPSLDQTNGSLSEMYKVPSAHNMMHEDMPAWIVFFDPHSKDRIISGGDDLCMHVWSLPSHDSDEVIKIGSNRKTHSAGVTSGQWHPQFSNVFATGSYDEYVRLWDVRDVTKPLLEIHTGEILIIL